jgi:hypothetical protein
VKVIKSDIKSKERKALLEGIAKHALSTLINVDEYKTLLTEKN